MVAGDLQQESAENRLLEANTPQGLADLKSAGVRACSGIPLLHQRHSLGALCLFSRQPRIFTAENQALQVTIGQQIATAVSNVRLFQTVADERSLLHAVIASSRDGIMLVGPERQVQLINAPALAMARLPGTPEEWRNRPMAALLVKLRRQAPALVRAALAEIRRVENRHAGPGEGEAEVDVRVLRWLSLPVFAGSELLGRLVVLRDVTEERSLEQMREDLTHAMVHDLRSPLTGILGSVEYLERSLAAHLTPQQRQVVDIARSNTQRMLKLVSAILDISRLESGRLPLERSPIALADLVGEAITAHLPLVAQKGQTLQHDVPATLPLAWADAGLYERVMQNLLGNATKFTPAGGSICVRSWLDAEKPRLVVSVSDSGPGIPAELFEQVFEKFATGGREESGSGLGLTFCKMVVEAHGQRIWVENAPDGGAIFTFTLPLLPQAQI
jgi:signal transduction histidine kinase